MSDVGAARDAAFSSFEWKHEWTIAIGKLEEALEALDRIDASVPAAHLSLALETLRLWSPRGEPHLPASWS